MITGSSHDVLLPGRIDGREGTQTEGTMEFSEKHQPIIGIPIPVQQGNQGPLLLADAIGPWAIERMHGRIFLIPLWPFPTHEYVYQSLWPLLQSMDGLFLPAGIQKIDGPLHQNERAHQPESEIWSIAWEIALAQLASFLGMPLLAVADGAEKWNSALGGKREEAWRNAAQTVSTSLETWDRHTIRVREPSKLASYLQPAIALQDGEHKPWELAFMPSSGVEKLAPGLLSCAQSEDGTVVAFERRDEAFGLGILGRLDWGLDQTYGTSLFEVFLHACRSFHLKRLQAPDWEASRDMICATLSERVVHGGSLLSVPLTIPKEKRQHTSRLSGSFSPSPAFSRGSTGDLERVRQRSPLPTKEDLNKIRRQHLKRQSDERGHQ
jgi:gamma-glutamyl-gamma-aminobutyrate hydrolase PuuD